MRNITTSPSNEDFSSAVLPCQFNDLIRRRSSGIVGEYRLLWAVLEDAIRTYLSNVKRDSERQCKAFDEVAEWFFAEPKASHGLFGFQSVCDALGIGSHELVLALNKLQVRDLPMRRYNRALKIAKVPRLAA